MSASFGTPPAPPPKPSQQTNQSGTSTPGTSAGPRPAPPVPSSQAGTASHQYGSSLSFRPQDGNLILHEIEQIRGPEEGWLPEVLKDKSTSDLHTILSSPDLQHALVHAPQSQHASIPLSNQHLQTLLSQNIALASSLVQQEQHLANQREHTQSRLLALRALERQWKQTQQKQDDALRDFSASALYQKLAAAVVEQGALCRTIEEGWLEEEGVASEREVADFVRRTREARKVAYLRRERKERWDEGRIGGWRG